EAALHRAAGIAVLRGRLLQQPDRATPNAEREGRSQRARPQGLRSALRRDGGSLPARAGGVVRQGEGGQGALCRGVRGLRVRPAAREGRTAEAVPVLPGGPVAVSGAGGASFA